MTHKKKVQNEKKCHRNVEYVPLKSLFLCVHVTGFVCTSVHDAAGVHVLQCTTQLNKVLPYCLLGNQPSLFLEMLQAINK